jgi:hypothetical protein
MESREAQRFFDLGVQYYAAARFAAFAWLIPVSGNLFHHAIEMFLKGHLSSKMTLRELLKFQHRLKDLWLAYKVEVADNTLARFDQMIAEIDEFEDLRLPDRVLANGMSCIISIVHIHEPTDTSRPEHQYQIVVKEIDVLVKVLFEKASLNPSFFSHMLGDEAIEYLTKDNEFRICEELAG